MHSSTPPVLFITGAARRLGAAVARYFHARGYNLALHYQHSREAAEALVAECCDQRPGSAVGLCAALGDIDAVAALPRQVISQFGRIDVLINNASAFYPTPWGDISAEDWDALIDSNLKGPCFLSQACLPALRQANGCIINLIDIHAERPLADHPVYCAAKAGLSTMTRSLARDTAIRVNGIAPGAILWPEQDAATISEQGKAEVLARIPMARCGEAEDIARTAWFLATEAPYITGQIISVDGGRTAVS